MSRINNSELTKEIINGARLQVGSSLVPNQIAEKVVPVMEVNPRLLKNTNYLLSVNKSTSAGTTTLIPAIPNQDVYLTYLSIAVVADATCDWADGSLSINATINGISQTLLTILHVTLTAVNNTVSISLPFPLKIDRNVALSIAGPTFTVGKLRQTFTAGYFLVENPNA